MRLIQSIILAISVLYTVASPAQTADDRPWLQKDSIVIIDPYEGNSIDWAAAKTDPKLKGMIHRAYIGLRKDSKYEARVASAREAGLLVGAYLLGLPGDPIQQADALIDIGKKTGVQLLALDIENLDPKKSMTLPDAVRFLDHVHERTGRYPVFYTNFSTYQRISSSYGKNSTFAKTPLWLARFGQRHGMSGNVVWSTYAIWQFQSEINCAPCPKTYGGSAKACRKRADEVIVNEACYHSVPGTRPDMDVNVFNGSEAELKSLFGGG